MPSTRVSTWTNLWKFHFDTSQEIYRRRWLSECRIFRKPAGSFSYKTRQVYAMAAVAVYVNVLVTVSVCYRPRLLAATALPISHGRGQ